jgi:hypothetical protein
MESPMKRRLSAQTPLPTARHMDQCQVGCARGYTGAEEVYRCEGETNQMVPRTNALVCEANPCEASTSMPESATPMKPYKDSKIIGPSGDYELILGIKIWRKFGNWRNQI